MKLSRGSVGGVEGVPNSSSSCFHNATLPFPVLPPSALSSPPHCTSLQVCCLRAAGPEPADVRVRRVVLPPPTLPLRLASLGAARRRLNGFPGVEQRVWGCEGTLEGGGRSDLPDP